ncbi:MAG: hypothetical protein Q9217_002459 [Psora testacea]
MAPQALLPQLDATYEGDMDTLDTSCECLAAAVADLKELGEDFTELVRYCGDLACATCAGRQLQTVCPKDAQHVGDEQLANANAQLDEDISAFFENPNADLPKPLEDGSAADFLAQGTQKMDCGGNVSQLIDAYIAEYSRKEDSDFDELLNMENAPLLERSVNGNYEPWEMVDVHEQQVGLAELEEAGFEWVKTTK